MSQWTCNTTKSPGYQRGKNVKYRLQNVPPTDRVTDKRSSNISVQITFESSSDSVINERRVTEIPTVS